MKKLKIGLSVVDILLASQIMIDYMEKNNIKNINDPTDHDIESVQKLYDDAMKSLDYLKETI